MARPALLANGLMSTRGGMAGLLAILTPNHNSIVAGTILRIGISPVFPSAIFRHKRRGLRARAVRMLGFVIGRGVGDEEPFFTGADCRGCRRGMSDRSGAGGGHQAGAPANSGRNRWTHLPARRTGGAAGRQSAASASPDPS